MGSTWFGRCVGVVSATVGAFLDVGGAFARLLCSTLTFEV